MKKSHKCCLQDGTKVQIFSQVSALQSYPVKLPGFSVKYRQMVGGREKQQKEMYVTEQLYKK